MKSSSLFEPFTFKGLNLRNRTVMAPMTRGFAPGGRVTSEVADYYARRAANDVGLIISEGTGVARAASVNGASLPHFHGAEALAAWGQVVGEVHRVGGVMAPQLWHVGAVPSPYGNGPGEDDFESPSGMTSPNSPYGKMLSDSDVADVIAAFARAAADAKQLGFDALELHGAHGYLIDQFFWSETNRREDGWNGDTIVERARFASHLIAAVRNAVGMDFPIILRLSQWKQQNYDARLARTPTEMEQWLRPLVDAGADILHCSQRRFWEPEFPDYDGTDGLNFAGWAKKLMGVPTITVGSVGLSGDFLSAFAGQGSSKAGLDELERRLERDEFDLVAIGRALLNDSAWVGKVRRGATDEVQDFAPSSMAELT
jgi:2,4-dienoyl-CoA reductase-like NADH-dependent reductase (Old Yellow Enzyme family)